jgi:hypothetical protein
MLTSNTLRVLNTPLPTSDSGYNGISPATSRLAELYNLNKHHNDTRFHNYSPGDVNGSYWDKQPNGHIKYVSTWQLVEKTKMMALRHLKDDPCKWKIEAFLDAAWVHGIGGKNMAKAIRESEGNDEDRLEMLMFWYGEALEAIFKKEMWVEKTPEWYSNQTHLYLSLALVYCLMGCGTKANECALAARTSIHLSHDAMSAAEMMAKN